MARQGGQHGWPQDSDPYDTGHREWRGDQRSYQQPRPYQEPRSYREPQSYREPRYERAAYGAPPPPPPVKKRRWPFILVGLVLSPLLFVGCLVAVVAGGSSQSGSGSPGASSAAKPGGSQAQGLFQHPEDIAISTCTTDELGMMIAQIVVTNQSAKASTYAVELSFQSADGKQQYASGHAIITTLAAGQQRPEKVQTFTEPPSAGQFSCVVVSAQRTQAL